MSTTLDIITIPHPTLRRVAQPVEHVDKKVTQFMGNLLATLDHKRNPSGVGLAAPQVDKSWRIFATKLSAEGDRSQKNELRVFINPVITNTSSNQELGTNPDDPDLEGCLSIPRLFGPVPRWQWVEIEYQVIDHNQLQKRSERFVDFAARVVQHEIDHLDGILFTDHIIKHGLPLYQLIKGSDDLEEIDPSLLEGI